ncbi:hypothetical protein [Inquilinus sp. OTU3971]|uniref:hypothetical protein n=1 Tax=Inquilinus sp. OTU3971 TaxID=3043855 RepID=UPI00313DED13
MTPFIIWYSDRRFDRIREPPQPLLSTERDTEADAVRAAHAIETSGKYVHQIQRDDGTFISRIELLQMWLGS